ncbi:DNA endonuclease SmrA [Marinibactrum halimedae]|uniref:Smr domain-containing protein n=1 Tax=Marinibactrum halimedae TaxID=1444977 RepID=A0AA37WNX1_9GAMM|nr:DNA endonuclease SmrA [Marinibactrum halimedae]MCD9458813.1 DNA endonuclease SmrA [Marinibactrum halimedae]GLS25372.1 Smr domain-containing protein [Marinibactrum halimedae]
MSEEKLLFEQAMEGVTRIRKESRVQLSSPSDTTNILARRMAATNEEVSDQSALTGETDHIEMLDPLDELAFKRPGIQNGVYRNMRLGKYGIEARLDLHRMTVDQARRALYQFVQDCVEQDIRCALITHGKGEGRGQPPVLKSCVAHWLPQLDLIQAFHSAQRHHGGVGATYIMLKKSERKRQDDLERHQKRRG